MQPTESIHDLTGQYCPYVLDWTIPLTAQQFTMRLSPKPPAPVISSALTESVGLDAHIAEDSSFPSAYLRAVGAIASADGTVNLPEFAALNDIVRVTGESALAGVMLLNAIEHPLPISDALKRLQAESTTVDYALCKVCFDAAKPLLGLQGGDSRELAMQLATALRYPVSESELDHIVTAENHTLWNIIARKTLRVVRGNGLVEFAEECYRVTGESDILTKIRSFNSGKVDDSVLRSRIFEACEAISHQLAEYEEKLHAAESAEASAKKFIETTRALEKQVQQRLAIMDARIQFELQTFAEDVEDVIHDAGNAFELDVADRLKTDKWQAAKVWESIGRMTFGKELKFRVDRIVFRREEMLRLLKEDLRLFQEEIRIGRTSILERQHHSRFSDLMPPLRIYTRVVNTVDNAASMTLKAGALSLAGTGCAIYALGTAVVFPIIAPVAPFVGGAIVLAGIVKWFTDADGRKDDEIRNKRRKFEAELRIQLEQARASLIAQLSDLANEFRQTAKMALEPVLLESQAVERLTDLQMKTAKRLVRQSRSAVSKLVGQVAALPVRAAG